MKCFGRAQGVNLDLSGVGGHLPLAEFDDVQVDATEGARCSINSLSQTRRTRLGREVTDFRGHVLAMSVRLFAHKGGLRPILCRQNLSTSRWPSSSGGGLQNRRGWCNSSTGFHFSGHKC